MKALRINLGKLKGFAVRTINGREGPVKCIIIPVDKNPCIFIDSNENYAIMNLIEIPLKRPSRYGDTDMLKASVSREAYSAMSPDERSRIPILGNSKPVGTDRGDSSRDESRKTEYDDDDLPY